MQMEKVIKELTLQRDLFQSRAENSHQSAGKDRLLNKGSASESSGVANNLLCRTDSASENFDRTTSSLSMSSSHLLQQTENAEDNFLLDGSSPTFVGPDPCHGWEEMTSRAESKDNCKEVPCIEIKKVKTDCKTHVNTPPIPASEETGVNTPTIQDVNVDAKSSSGNEHNELSPVAVGNSQMELSKKSNGSSESKPHILDAMSPPKIDKVDQHPQISNLEQNEKPSRFNMLDQEPASPPQLDESDKVSATLPTGVKSSMKCSPTHKMGASVEDIESVWDSDSEETASVLNFVVRMNQKAKQKPLNKDMDDIMVSTRQIFTHTLMLSIFLALLLIRNST